MRRRKDKSLEIVKEPLDGLIDKDQASFTPDPPALTILTQFKSFLEQRAEFRSPLQLFIYFENTFDSVNMSLRRRGIPEKLVIIRAIEDKVSWTFPCINFWA